MNGKALRPGAGFNPPNPPCPSGLVPTRFLTMVSHLVLLLTILLSRDDYVRACLPFDHDTEAFGRKDVELVSAKLGSSAE